MTSFKFGRKARWSPQRDVRELSAALARAEDGRDAAIRALADLAHQIHINDFTDSLGHQAKMLKAFMDACALLSHTTPSERKPNT